MAKVAFAAAAHPDDIEFMMAGTLILLGKAGWQLHYMNIASGSCGTATLSRTEIVRVRIAEAREAAAKIGAVFHPPLVDDLMIYYTPELTARTAAVVREVNPQILLLPSPQDYMEDHMNASRLMVTGAFVRGMRNFATDPPVPPVEGEMAVYHALPYGLRDQLRKPLRPDFYINIETVLQKKREMLAFHRSQKEWLDRSQGLDSYLNTMTDVSAEVGRMSGRFSYAEGWRRHLHLGFGAEEYDPLREALADFFSHEF